MTSYYAERLSGRQLEKCYAVAPSRVQQYLEREIEHLLTRVRGDDVVLELGCGYGRVSRRLAERAHLTIGIDVAEESVVLARRRRPPALRCEFGVMNATALGFARGAFDVVACVQNGICAFGVRPIDLVREALRVARPGGRVVLSTYADRFWPHRLQWFEAQSAAGLMGAIDRVHTGNGVIACTDGFRSGTFSPAQFKALASELGVDGRLTEVDDSSVFFEVGK